MGLLEKLDSLLPWQKRIAFVVFLVTGLGGIYHWAGVAWGAIRGFAPLAVKVDRLESSFGEHIDDFAQHDVLHAQEHGELHEWKDTLLTLVGAVAAKQDTFGIKQDWFECDRLRRRDELEGRAPRDCPPFLR